MIQINMPEGAKHIIRELNKNGFEAYIVGGCVRDSLLKKTPKDWDITTSAKPLDIKAIFKRTIDTGIQHGTVTVLFGKEAYEVTTYRVDGVYEDHRRPSGVTFTASLEEDLKRRDFTINAMAYNEGQGIIDKFGGIEDLRAKIIRCVGQPEERFDEDALRILRAVRFAAQLGFTINEATRQAMKDKRHFLRDISAERIQVELTKLITSEHPEELLEAYELGLTEIVLPEFDDMMHTSQNNPHHLYNVGEHTISVMKNIPATPVYRYTALLHDTGKAKTKVTGADGIDHFYNHQTVSGELAGKVLRRLKLDNATINETKKLVINHDFGITGEISEKSFRRFVSRLGVESVPGFFAIREADMAGQSDYKREEKLEQLEKMKQLYQVILDEGQCLSLKDLAVKGRDLMEAGMTAGKEMGEMLNFLLDKVIENPKLNTKEALMAIFCEKQAEK